MKCENLLLFASLGFGLLIWQNKQCEDVSLSSGKLLLFLFIYIL